MQTGLTKVNMQQNKRRERTSNLHVYGLAVKSIRVCLNMNLIEITQGQQKSTNHIGVLPKRIISARFMVPQIIMIIPTQAIEGRIPHNYHKFDHLLCLIHFHTWVI